MKRWHWTVIVMSVCAAVLIGWDIYVAVHPDPDDTISEILNEYSRHPILPFAFGVLMGHWFWPLSPKGE